MRRPWMITNQQPREDASNIFPNKRNLFLNSNPKREPKLVHPLNRIHKSTFDLILGLNLPHPATFPKYPLKFQNDIYTHRESAHDQSPSSKKYGVGIEQSPLVTPITHSLVILNIPFISTQAQSGAPASNYKLTEQGVVPLTSEAITNPTPTTGKGQSGVLMMIGLIMLAKLTPGIMSSLETELNMR